MTSYRRVRRWCGIAPFARRIIRFPSPKPRTRVSFIAASEGDATFLRTSEDYHILINGTGEPGTLMSFLDEPLPPWDRRLDLVIATHLDDGNASLLNAVLERYTVGQVVEPPAPERLGSFTTGGTTC